MAGLEPATSPLTVVTDCLRPVLTLEPSARWVWCQPSYSGVARGWRPVASRTATLPHPRLSWLNVTNITCTVSGSRCSTPSYSLVLTVAHRTPGRDRPVDARTRCRPYPPWFHGYMTITPIPTWHSGCMFRSRLEARWAVLLEALGAKWQYEPQGWHLGDKLAYLPDFWIPHVSGFLEVRGLWDYRARAPLLMAEIGEWPIYLALGGIPSERQLRSTGWFDESDQTGVVSLTQCYDWNGWFPADTPEVMAACERARSEHFTS